MLLPNSLPVSFALPTNAPPAFLAAPPTTAAALAAPRLMSAIPISFTSCCSASFSGMPAKCLV